MKIVYLASTSSLGPASRYRIYQFQKYFEEAQIDLEILPALPDTWLRAEQKSGLGRRCARIGAGMHGLMRRIKQMSALKAAQLVIIEREIFPKLPNQLEKWLLPQGCKYGVELDDAIYLSPGREQKYPQFLKRSAFVIAGNQQIADWVRPHQDNVHVVPTCVPVQAYEAKQNYQMTAPARIGWVGLPSNLPYVSAILPSIQSVFDKHACEIYVLSGRAPQWSIPHQFEPWDANREPESISNFDIGIMPLPQTPYAAGKCGLKILQYMAAGVPVIASAVGVNQTIIEDGVNGILVHNPNDWAEALERLLTDQDLREKLGRAGRQRVESGYSTEAWGPKLVALYKDLAANR